MESCLVYGKSHGGEVCLPWVLSASATKAGSFKLEYGLLWNSEPTAAASLGRLLSVLTPRRVCVAVSAQLRRGRLRPILHQLDSD